MLTNRRETGKTNNKEETNKTSPQNTTEHRKLHGVLSSALVRLADTYPPITC